MDLQNLPARSLRVKRAGQHFDNTTDNNYIVVGNALDTINDILEIDERVLSLLTSYIVPNSSLVHYVLQKDIELEKAKNKNELRFTVMDLLNCLLRYNKNRPDVHKPRFILMRSSKPGYSAVLKHRFNITNFRKSTLWNLETIAKFLRSEPVGLGVKGKNSRRRLLKLSVAGGLVGQKTFARRLALVGGTKG
jgi:hypothetical protein